MFHSEETDLSFPETDPSPAANRFPISGEEWNFSLRIRSDSNSPFSAIYSSFSKNTFLPVQNSHFASVRIPEQVLQRPFLFLKANFPLEQPLQIPARELILSLSPQILHLRGRKK